MSTTRPHNGVPWPTRGFSASAAVGTVWALGAALFLAFQYRKGAITDVQGWGLVYWWLDYGDGMVRRGLIGQLFQSGFGVLSREALYRPVMFLHVGTFIFLAGVAVALSSLIVARLDWRGRLSFAAVAAWVFAGQFWPTVAYNLGYLDVYIVALALAAALLLMRGWIIPAGLLMAAGPFAHEYFVFLTPFILACAWRPDADRPGQVSGRSLVMLGLVVLASSAAVILLSRPPATVAQLAQMPLPADQKKVLAEVTMGQGVVPMLARMLDLMRQHFGRLVGHGLFFLTPTLVATAGILLWRAPKRTPVLWLRAAAGLFPISTLLIAWDLSRLLCMSGFTAGMLFLVAAWDRTGERRSSLDPASASRTPLIVGAASLVLAALYGLTPLTYTYFGGPNYFRYPADRVGNVLNASLPATLFKNAFSKPAPFVGGDYACRLKTVDAGPPEGCVHILASDQMVFGPYVPLPAGQYSVQFDLTAPEGCRNPVTFDVSAVNIRRSPIAQTETVTGGDARVRLDFQIGLDLANVGLLEFRTVQSQGPACAALRHVRLKRLSP